MENQVVRNNIVTVYTKIRPIKKMFIIEEEDIERLLSVIKLLTEEVTGIKNLIFVNEKSLYSENFINFVDRHNPDTIINYSNFDDKDLEKLYKIPVYSISKYGINKLDDIVRSLSTPMTIFDNIPTYFDDSFSRSYQTLFTFLNIQDTYDSIDLLHILNFGKTEKKFNDNLKETLFKGIYLNQLTDFDEIFENLFLQKKNFLYSMLLLAKISDGSSVWNRDFNPDKLFQEKTTAIIGDTNNISSMVYFWNVRATYPRNLTFWFPLEMFENNKDKFNDISHFCVFSENDSLAQYIDSNAKTVIDHSKYYFGTFTHEWETYEYVQNCPIIDEKIKIVHPIEKLPSRVGFNTNLALDIYGCKEFHLPKSIKLGKLLTNFREDKLFPQNFSRIGKLSLTKYASHFRPYNQNPIIEEINLIPNEKIFEAIFNEIGYDIRQTSTTRAAKELVDIFGGIEKLDILTERSVFELLVKLTPPRYKKIEDLICNLVDVKEKGISQELRENIQSILLINSNKIVSIDQISSMMSIKKSEKERIFSLIEKLYKMGVLLRGKYFECPNCGTYLWYELATISKQNKCVGCNREVEIPIFSNSIILSDYYKLNELVCQAVDQGLLPVLLTTNLLMKFPFFSKRFVFDYEVFESPSSNKPIAEIDIMFNFGNLIGLSEVKANRGFDHDQIDRMVNLATINKIDILVFSSLKKRNTEEISDIVEYLSAKKLDIPAFILTGDVLFGNIELEIAKYFEVNRETGNFYDGPIILEERK